MSKKIWQVLSKAHIRKRGGSWVLTLPVEVARLLDVGADDDLLFLLDFDSKMIAIVKQTGNSASTIGGTSIEINIPKDLKEIKTKNG